MKKSEPITGARKKIEDYSYSLSCGIGKGYSSQVYKGRHDVTGMIIFYNTEQEVAIKVIDIRMLKGEVHKNLLASEIEVLKTLRNSPHIIELYDIYNTKNNTYIVTQLCQGGDLAKTISSRKVIPEPQAIDIMKQIIIGYGQMHKQGIIHRDLKPANIFLKNGQIKLADFGFAMRANDGKKFCTYNVGSPIYMPPEALNENKYSFKSDIWALGVIFYEMLTGKTPWKAKTEKQLGKQLSSVPIRKLLPKNISQPSTDFLLRTLQVQFSQRMCPQEIVRFLFEDMGRTNTLSLQKRSQRCGSIQKNDPQQTSLTRNSVNTPKNIRRFNVIRGAQECKNSSLPKTAATIGGKTQQQLPSCTASQKKLISKQLLSQVHFCRFLYKLLNRIKQKINGNISMYLKQLMSNLIFKRLQQIKQLNQLQQKIAKQYKYSPDYQKILQIIIQYQNKYQRQMNYQNNGKIVQLDQLQDQLTNQIVKMYNNIINNSDIQDVKEEVIVLDYLVTLRQLITLLQTNSLEGFHVKSKMEAIVQGAPSKNITKEHIRAISAKLKAIKLL